MVQGSNIDEPPILMFTRPFRCPAGDAKCCCFQEVAVTDGAGTDLGHAIERCYCCVPGFSTESPGAGGKFVPEYDFHQPTCCGGMMVNCCAQGLCNCRIPFLIYPPGGDEASVLKSSGSTPVPGQTGVPDAQITKVWSGLATELFTDADTFELKAPDDSDANGKARLIGATLMINQLFFEGGKDENGAGN